MRAQCAPKLIGFRQAIASISTVVGRWRLELLVQQYGWRTPFIGIWRRVPLRNINPFRFARLQSIQSGNNKNTQYLDHLVSLDFVFLGHCTSHSQHNAAFSASLSSDGRRDEQRGNDGPVFPLASSVISNYERTCLWLDLYSKLRSHTATVALIVMGVSFVVIGLTSDSQ